MTEPVRTPLEKADVFFLGVLFALLLLRLASVIWTPLYLGPDEAQYWRWGKSFDWGYFSKPPFTAWLIGASTTLFGDAEWAIRLPSPLFHTGTAFLLWLTGRTFWSPIVGLFAGLSWALMGGVWLSSVLMTTDVPLLFFWSLGLFALFSLRAGGGLKAAILFGTSLSLGFLSKYAMIYFVMGLGLALLFDRETRKALLSVNGLIALIVFLLLFGPHILWNAQNGFQTVGHTADNANWGASLFNPDAALQFIGDQLGVFAPIHFILLVILSVAGLLLKSTFFKSEAKARLLIMFIAPPLLIIIGQAFISRAHANWAATAYPAACLLLAAWAVYAKGWVRVSLISGLVLNIAIGAVFSTLILTPRDARPKAMVKAISKSARAWPETINAVNAKAAEIGASAIILDEREIWHNLDYYGRDGIIPVPVRMWRSSGEVKSASEEAPITEADSRRALFLALRNNESFLKDFREYRKLDEIVIDIGGNRERRFYVFIVEGFAPVPR